MLGSNGHLRANNQTIPYHYLVMTMILEYSMNTLFTTDRQCIISCVSVDHKLKALN